MGDQNNDLLVNLIFKLQNEGKLKDAKVDLKGIEQGAQAAGTATRQMGDHLASGAAVGSDSVRQLGTNIDRAGRQAMIGLRSLADFGNIFGAGRGFSTAIAQGAIMTDAIGDLTGVLTAMNPVMLAVTGAGAALALVFGSIAEESRKAEEAARQALAPYIELVSLTRDLDKISPPLAQAMRERWGLSKDAAAALLQQAGAEDQLRQKIEQRAGKDLALKTLEDQLVQSSKRLTDQEEKMRASVRAGLVTRAESLGLLAPYQSAVAALTQRIGELRAEQDAELGELNTKANEYARLKGVFDGLVIVDEDYVRTLKEIKVFEDENRRAVEARTKALEALGRAQRDILKGMIEKAMAPTKVTQEDLEATKAGTYKDKWDEFARRADAVAKGTDPAAYGANFKKMFDDLGMGAEEAAAKFRDFSLFADPKNLKILSEGGALDTIEADVERQIDSAIGKANAMKEAMKKVWDKLSEEKKEALKKLGIETLDDAQKKALGLAEDIAVGAKQSDEFAANLKKIRSVIEETLGGDVTIHVNYDGSPSATTNSGTNLGENLGTETGAYGIAGFADGGAGYVRRSGLIWLDAGEQFWASGTRNQVPPPAAPAGPLVGQVVLNNGLDVERLLNDLARRVRNSR